MSQESDKNKYIGIEINHFKSKSKDITFDVFLRLTDNNYAHVFSKNTGLDYTRLFQYIQKGVTHLYILSEDQDKCNEYMKQTSENLLNDPKVTHDKKLAHLINLTDQVCTDLFSQVEVPNEIALKTKKLVQNFVNVLNTDPKTMSILIKLASHGDYLYYHSIATSVFAMMIARAMGTLDQRMVEIVGLGGFLHDIGHTKLPKNITESQKDLSPKEWKEMRSHSKIGLTMLEKTSTLPDEVRYIVYQHHEALGGVGYPNGLRGDAIYLPARIVAVADGFSALVSKRPFRAAYSVSQAIQILENENQKYDPNIVSVLSAVITKHLPSRKKAA